ncbi:MAG: SUMF1/EgtB/PvdO family nonheme iron enzyme, partial [Verrucomicrobiota bacterium]
GNHLSDIFGLGRILYQCFCAELPSGAFASMPSQKTGLPTFIDDAVLGAMHYEPDQRPQSIAQLVQELSGHLTRVPTDTSSDHEDPTVRNSLLKRYDHDFSWLRWFLPIALTVTVLGLLSHFAFQYITAPDPESEQALLHSSLDPNAALTLIARARVLHADGQVVPSKAIIKEVATSADTSAPVLKEMLSTLEDWEEYELALELGKAFTDRSPFETQVRNDLSNILAAREKIIVPFLEFQALSDSARTQGDDFLELEALQRSAELIPGSMTINHRINENPVFIYSGIMDGIGALKSLHPDYDSWRIHVYVDRKGSRVDLSHNIGLNNIGPLAGLPINELDISWTRVTDLSPVQSMPISVLRIDSTPIRDISPLEKNSLTVFTFNHAPVTDVSVLEEMKSLKSARGHYKDSTFKKYLPPNAASVWENTLGMRFRPIDDGKALMSVWETRYADYRAYAISSKLAIIPEMLRFADDKWLADGATWKKPGYDTKDDHPVVGVSKRDIARFCKWLTEKDLDRGAIKKGQLYRLPTDSEWNTVVQTTNNILLNPKTRSLQPSSDLSPYNSLPNQALEYWEGITSEASALPTLTTTEAGGDEDWIGPVGRFDSINGFYDLLGNVREWCSDTSDHKQTGSIVRGSDFSTGRISPQNRTSLDQEARYSDLGFRIVLQLKPPKVDLPLITALNKKNWETAAKIALPDAINHPNRAVRDAARDYLVLDRWIADPTKRGSDLLNNSRLKSFGESTYFLVRIPLPWADAKAIAAATGGHLAVVTSPEEQKWIEDEFFGPQSAQTLWLGAFARGSDWKWITGDPWGFEHRPIPKPDSFNAALILVPTHLSKEGTHHFANWLPDNPLEPHAFLIEWHTPQSLPRADEQDNPLSNASPHDPVDTGSSSAITTAGDSLTAAP